MNIGIIIYSQTGNTLSVGQKLEKALTAAGHKAEIKKVEIEPVEKNSKPAPVKLITAPDVSSYDAVIFAAPVHGFSLAPAMKEYLSQVQSLSGKKVCCYVTQHFKRAWLGGNKSVSQIKAACEAKGAAVTASGVIGWSSPVKDKQIEDTVNSLCAAMGAKK